MKYRCGNDAERKEPCTKDRCIGSQKGPALGMVERGTVKSGIINLKWY